MYLKCRLLVTPKVMLHRIAQSAEIGPNLIRYGFARDV
jgi:hypothetical protein